MNAKHSSTFFKNTKKLSNYNNRFLKEHQSNIKNAKNNTAIERLALKILKSILIKQKKLSNYNNRTYGYCHETIEIKSNNTTCNDGVHFFLIATYYKREEHAQRKREKMNRTTVREN